MRIDEAVDDASGVQKGKTFGDLGHDFEDVSEMRVRAAFVHEVEQRSTMNALLQNHHLIQDA